jgi:hypothetical protein
MKREIPHENLGNHALINVEEEREIYLIYCMERDTR